MYQEKPPILGLKVDDNHFVDCYDYACPYTESDTDDQIIPNWKCFLFHNKILESPPIIDHTIINGFKCYGHRYEGNQMQSMRGFDSPEHAVAHYAKEIADGDYIGQHNSYT